MPSTLNGTRRRPRAIVSAALAAFGALAFCVFTGLTDHFDITVLELARPHDAWGPAQIRADHLVQAMQPAVALSVQLVVATILSVHHRSARPLVLAVLVDVGVTLAVVVVKALGGRPDPHASVEHGGSFPSGHTVSAVVCAGLVLLLLRPRPRAGLWLVPAGLGAVMAAALVVEGAHWTTDVLGGAALGAAALAAVVATGAASWAAPPADHGAVGRRRPANRPVPGPGGASDGEPGGADAAISTGGDGFVVGGGRRLVRGRLVRGAVGSRPFRRLLRALPGGGRS